METRQVKFCENGEWKGGIVVDDEYLICGCCGGVYCLDDSDDMLDIEGIADLGGWINISEEIIGE